MTAVLTGGAALLVDRMASWKCKGERENAGCQSPFTLASETGKGRFGVMFVVQMSNLRNMVEQELNEVHLIQSAMGLAPSSVLYIYEPLITSWSREISWFTKVEMESLRSRLGGGIPVSMVGFGVA